MSPWPLRACCLALSLLPGALHADPPQGLPNVVEIDLTQLTDRRPGPDRVKAAYLGIATTPANATLRNQLGLTEGVGLQVAYVDPSSPAQAAGIEQHDVLEKVNDQIIINPHQLAVLIRTFKPGDEVSLTLIRQGRRIPIKATLVEKELPVLNDEPLAALLNRIDPLAAMPMLQQIEVPPGASSVTGMFADQQHVLTLTRRDGVDHLEVREAPATGSGDQKQLFSGPVQTPADIERLPPGVPEKLQALRQTLGVTAAAATSQPAQTPGNR